MKQIQNKEVICESETRFEETNSARIGEARSEKDRIIDGDGLFSGDRSWIGRLWPGSYNDATDHHATDHHTTNHHTTNYEATGGRAQVWWSV
jgi:hypothetical protein